MLKNVMNSLFYIRILILWLVALSTSAFTQTTKVIITGDYAEPYLAIDPTDSKQMLIGANNSYFAWTSNGGVTWQPRTLGFGSRGDHVTGFDVNGNGYVMRLTPSQVMFCKSVNGVEWKCDTLPRSGRTDKPWFAIDHHVNVNNLYAVWTEFTRNPVTQEDDSAHITFIRSLNGGSTWEKPIALSEKLYLTNHAWLVGAQAAVGASGEVLICWSGTDSMYFCISLDQGRNFTKPQGVAKHKVVDLNISGVIRSWSMPVLLCDTSQSQYRGRIYLLYADSADDGDIDIFETHSDNKGISWSQSLSIINADDNTIQYLPAAAITRRGNIICTFMDRREGLAGKPANYTTLYAARSVDGGQSWSNFSLQGPGAEQIADFPGDYMSLAANGDDLFAAWALKAGLQESIFLTQWKDSLASGAAREKKSDSGIRLTRKEGKLFLQLPVSASYVRMILYDMLGRVVFQNEYDLLQNEYWFYDIPAYIQRAAIFASIQTKRTYQRPYITLIH